MHTYACLQLRSIKETNKTPQGGNTAKAHKYIQEPTLVLLLMHGQSLLYLWCVVGLTTCLLVLQFEFSRGKEDLSSAAVEFVRYFDTKHPSPEQLFAQRNGLSSSSFPAGAVLSGTAISMNEVYTPQQLQNLHIKRCIAIDVPVAVDDMVNKKWSNSILQSLRTPVLVSTPCLGSDSLGNNLGSYFESMLCARTMGLHFIGVVPVWEPSQNDKPSVFLSAMPMVVASNRSVVISEVMSTIRNVCRCPGSCHERKYALWTQNLNVIRPLLWNAVQNHLASTFSQHENHTIVRSSDLSTVASGSVLPLIPDVAIHYRCGDNFVGHYGFLPFSAFVERIPAIAKTIFVLAENRDRKTKQKKHLASKCDAVFPALLDFLKVHFPFAAVVIRRGDDLYTDMARLAMAKVTICSASTFCLWPAVMHRGQAYFPQSKLIVGGDVSVDLGFQWITSPSILLGKQFEGIPVQQFVGLLSSGENKMRRDAPQRQRRPAFVY
jgi:hypothetical protein